MPGPHLKPTMFETHFPRGFHLPKDFDCLTELFDDSLVRMGSICLFSVRNKMTKKGLLHSRFPLICFVISEISWLFTKADN